MAGLGDFEADSAVFARKGREEVKGRRLGTRDKGVPNVVPTRGGRRKEAA